MNAPYRGESPPGPMRRLLTLVALLALAGVPSCPEKCDLSEMPPPDGHYTVTNPEDFPITVTDVLVEDGTMTIEYLDEAGEAQSVVYAISPS